jgi:hypothetical protein
LVASSVLIATIDRTKASKISLEIGLVKRPNLTGHHAGRGT